MKSVTDVDPGSIRWVRSHDDRHEYDLESGDDVLATLRWDGAVGSKATAESALGRWTLKRSGFLNPLIVVRDTGSGKDIAHLRAHPSHSSLILSDGQRLEWNRAGLMVPGWHFVDAKGREIVSFEPGRVNLKLEGGLVTISPEGGKLPELTLMLIVGWYFIVLAWIEDQAVAASSALLSATVGP
jgi:hypothetical protein